MNRGEIAGPVLRPCEGAECAEGDGRACERDQQQGQNGKQAETGGPWRGLGDIQSSMKGHC